MATRKTLTELKNQAFRECGAEPIEHRYSCENGFLNPSVHCGAMWNLIGFAKAQRMTA